jgi:hypothetical protein
MGAHIVDSFLRNIVMCVEERLQPKPFHLDQLLVVRFHLTGGNLGIGQDTI